MNIFVSSVYFHPNSHININFFTVMIGQESEHV